MSQENRNFSNETLEVSLVFGASVPSIVLGQCLWVNSQWRAAFQWSEQALALKLNISPLLLQPTPGVHYADVHPFNGLHAAFSDSIPDGFGLRFMNNGLVQAGYSLSDVTPLHRLAWIGQRGVGALAFNPVIDKGPSQTLADISRIAEHAANAQVEAFQDIPKEALRAGGSALGARPKFWAALGPDKKQILLGDAPNVPKGFQPCLLKFAPTDGNEDEPYFEAACLSLAAEHGVRSAKGELLMHACGPALAVHRFDRGLEGERLHTQSVAALLNLDFRTASMDYTELAKLVKRLAGSSEVERFYRQVCFNVALSIRDDHTKNFAFCMSSDGKWELSPAFDLCPHEGVGRSLEHTMTLNGKGVNFSRDDLLSFAKTIGLDDPLAKDGLDKSRAAASRFEKESRALGSSVAASKEWGSRLEKINKALAPTMVAGVGGGGSSKPTTRKARGQDKGSVR